MTSTDATGALGALDASALTWTDDAVLAGFERLTFALPAEDDGPLVATLVRRRCDTPSRRAVLWLHGFVDYFFHAHVADRMLARGWDVYALELRRYGRSLRGGNRPNYCTDVADYDTEIGTALDIVRDVDGHDTVVLLGHSTGGLVAATYAHRGARRTAIDGVVLNSPFFAFAVRSPRRFLLPIAERLGAVMPWGADPVGLPPRYGESLLAAHRGEWTYDTRWKPVRGFPIYFGWVRAIRAAQRTAERGLDVGAPVLLLHSSRSMRGSGPWADEMMSRDTVLEVEDMKRVGPRLGRDVTLQQIEGALHDVYLSRPDVREQAIARTLEWMDAKFGSATRAAQTAEATA